MDRKLLIALLAVLIFAACGSLYDAYSESSVEVNLAQKDGNDLISVDDETKEKSAEKPKEKVEVTEGENASNGAYQTVVYIEGAIAKPGLVYTNNNARMGEVVEAAGGFLANADIKNLNLADKVTDGQKITIPFKADDNILIANASNDENKSDLININTATSEELQKLPRVGPATAKSIIEYREKNGGFKNIDEIKNVPRIGEKTFEKFKDKIKV